MYLSKIRVFTNELVGGRSYQRGKIDLWISGEGNGGLEWGWQGCRNGKGDACSSLDLSFSWIVLIAPDAVGLASQGDDDSLASPRVKELHIRHETFVVFS